MHWTTAKLIKLEKAERYFTHAWSEHLRVEFGELVRALRSEIPPHLLSDYDQLKREHKEPVVGVCHKKCDGCHASLSPTALARLSKEHEASNCEQCGRFIYLAVGHDLAPSDRSHQPTGGHSIR
jgi:hypothetical protein